MTESETIAEPQTQELPPHVSGFTSEACINVKCRNYGNLQCSYSDICRARYCSKTCEKEHHTWFTHNCGPRLEKKALAKLLDDHEFEQTPSRAENLEQVKFHLRDDLDFIKTIDGVFSADVRECSDEVIEGEPMTRFAIYIRISQDALMGFNGMELSVIKGVPVFLAVGHEQSGAFRSGYPVEGDVNGDTHTSCTYGVGYDPKTEVQVVASKYDVALYRLFKKHKLEKCYEATRILGYDHKDLKAFAYNSVLGMNLGTIESTDYKNIRLLSKAMEPTREWMKEHGLPTVNRDIMDPSSGQFEQADEHVSPRTHGNSSSTSTVRRDGSGGGHRGDSQTSRRSGGNQLPRGQSGNVGIRQKYVASRIGSNTDKRPPRKLSHKTSTKTYTTKRRRDSEGSDDEAHETKSRKIHKSSVRQSSRTNSPGQRSSRSRRSRQKSPESHRHSSSSYNKHKKSSSRRSPKSNRGRSSKSKKSSHATERTYRGQYRDRSRSPKRHHS